MWYLKNDRLDLDFFEQFEFTQNWSQRIFWGTGPSNLKIKRVWIVWCVFIMVNDIYSYSFIIFHNG